jgi:xanthine/CO dehydrogenase XdhC/CoxF family maturation factor
MTRQWEKLGDRACKIVDRNVVRIRVSGGDALERLEHTAPAVIGSPCHRRLRRKVPGDKIAMCCNGSII